MSLGPDTPENPPTYDESELANDVWEPTILVLNDTTIHRESTDSAPLYRLSRAVSVITAATKVVEFERIEHKVKTHLASEGPEPVVKPRPRHIYNLRYWRRPTGLVTSMIRTNVPCVHVQAVSRRGTLGHLGVREPSRFYRRKGLKVYPMRKSGEVIAWLPSFDKDPKPVFQIQRKDGENIWKDEDDRVIAMEDSGEGQHKLILRVSLRQETADAIVALWCALIWQHSDQNTKPIIDEGLDGVRRAFRIAKENYPSVAGTRSGLYF